MTDNDVSTQPRSGDGAATAAAATDVAAAAATEAPDLRSSTATGDVANAMDRPNDQATDEDTEPAADRPTDGTTDLSTDGTTDRRGHGATDETAERATDETAERATDEATNQAGEQTGVQTMDRPAERPADSATDEDTALAADRPTQGATDAAGDQTSGQVVDDAVRQVEPPTGESTGEAIDPTPPDAAAGTTESVPTPAGTSKGGRAAQLEREGEVAADFLETLLDIADLDGDIEVDIDGDRASIAVVDSEEGRVPRRLVGPDARVLEALQELTRLAVQAATGERSRLILDVAGHRAARRAELVKLAQEAVEQVRAAGDRVALSPMTAFERKIVHDHVLAAGLTSESEGVEPSRFVVVLPT